ncbi:MAG: diguanylate cyclase [Methylophaga sp.]
MKSITFNPFPDDLDLLLDAFFAVEQDSTIQYASTGAEIVLGYKPEELIGKKLLDHVHPEDRHKTDGSVDQVMRTKSVMDFENRYIHKDGHIVHLLWSTSWSDKHQLRLGVARDISRIKQAEAMQKTLLAISETVHSDLTLKGIYPQLHQLLNTQIPGLDICIVQHRSQDLEIEFKSDNYWQPSLVALNPDDLNLSTSEIAIALQVKDKELGLIVFRLPAAMLNDNQQDLLQFTAAQITTALERQQMLERLQHMALYDPLTDLPNRQLFYDRLLQALARARREQHGLAVLYLDLDKFKEANDLLGHSAGDALLRDVAIRICTCVRDADTVVRIGGDEFVVLLNGIESRLQAWSVAEKIRHTLNQTFYWQNHSIEMSASIGVALFPEQGDNAEQLVTAADNAMYRAKDSGKNCVR